MSQSVLRWGSWVLSLMVILLSLLLIKNIYIVGLVVVIALVLGFMLHQQISHCLADQAALHQQISDVESLYQNSQRGGIAVLEYSRAVLPVLCGQLELARDESSQAVNGLLPEFAVIKNTLSNASAAGKSYVRLEKTEADRMLQSAMAAMTGLQFQDKVDQILSNVINQLDQMKNKFKAADENITAMQELFKIDEWEEKTISSFNMEEQKQAFLNAKGSGSATNNSLESNNEIDFFLV